MIQRIQSLYISVVVMLSTLMLYGSIVTFVGTGGAEYEIRYNGLYEMSGGAGEKTEPLLPLTILLLVVPALSFVTLLLFKRRKLQLRTSVFSLILLLGTVVMLAYYIFYIITKYDARVIFSIKIIFPVVSAILMYLAFRGILKDELLVRSYDRIR
jgi:hypothetical protein